jgi:hypothetical protein
MRRNATPEQRGQGGPGDRKPSSIKISRLSAWWVNIGGAGKLPKHSFALPAQGAPIRDSAPSIISEPRDGTRTHDDRNHNLGHLALSSKGLRCTNGNAIRKLTRVSIGFAGPHSQIFGHPLRPFPRFFRRAPVLTEASISWARGGGADASAAISAIKARPASITRIAARPHRDRSVVKRDVDAAARGARIGQDRGEHQPRHA